MGEEKEIKVMVVDDDITLRDMYAERLKIEGFGVEVSADGESALKKVKDFLPDVVLLDVMMPGMNGWTMLEELKKDSATKGIVVFMLSALIQEENQVKAEKGGAAGYILKSESTPVEVITKVKGSLKK